MPVDLTSRPRNSGSSSSGGSPALSTERVRRVAVPAGDSNPAAISGFDHELIPQWPVWWWALLVGASLTYSHKH